MLNIIVVLFQNILVIFPIQNPQMGLLASKNRRSPRVVELQRQLPEMVAVFQHFYLICG